MTGLDVFALIVLLVLILTVLSFVIFLGMWPSMVAKKNNHPQVEAITIGSWVTLIVGGVLWPIILIWAHIKTESKEAKQAIEVAQGEEQ